VVHTDGTAFGFPRPTRRFTPSAPQPDVATG
jgi:hypothetical protein